MSETPPEQPVEGPAEAPQPAPPPDAPAPAGPPEPPAPKPEPEHSKYRLELTIAIIGAVSALLGAVVGSGATIWVASTTSDTNKAIEQEKFKREEREKAYHQYISDYSDLANIAAGVGLTIGAYHHPNYPFDLLDETKKLSAANTKCDQSRHLVDLVGSSKIRDMVAKLEQAGHEMSSTASSSLEGFYDKSRDRTEDMKQASFDYMIVYNTLDHQIKDLVDATRADLDIAD